MMVHTCAGRQPRIVGILLALLICPCGRSFAATPEQVDAAIAKGRDYLLGIQLPEGRWEIDAKRNGKDHNWQVMQGDSYGGFTALATYALLSVGVDSQSPNMVKAIDFLRKADVCGIYSLGMRANVWELLPETAANREWRQAMIAKDCSLILGNMISVEGPTQGMWDYGSGKGVDPKKPRLDRSVSQFGVLGLWASAEDGADISIQVWRNLDSRWKSQQFPDGSWSYDSTPTVTGTHPVTPSMTAAGVATLFITEDFMYQEEAFACHGNITNPNIEKGMEWLSKNFDQGFGPYTMYGIERIGVASGRKYFGDVDWYQRGADYLIKSQKPDGSWHDWTTEKNELAGTAFALLFLARGRAPVLVNKLQYYADAGASAATTQPAEGPWNQRPRDVANIIRWTSKQTETDLNWQIVNMKTDAVGLAEAPILYICGDGELNFSSEDMQKLREFVWLGGMILGNADCANDRFAKSFEKLGSTLFGGEFRQLPAGHPIFTNEAFHSDRWKAPPVVLGLSNGVRELMLIAPQADPAKAWQVRASQTHKELFELADDIFNYAVDKRPSEKGMTHIVVPDPKIIPDRTLKLARLQYDGNWDPEPGSWKRLAAILRNTAKVDLQVAPVKLGGGTLAGFAVAHLTGTGRLALSDDQRAELLEWVGHGGTLIVDAAGGSSEFADSVEKELKAMFGSDAEKGLAHPLTPDHPIFALPTMTIQSVAYRPFARANLVGDATIPRIRGIEHGGRDEVFYSREDLTEGMVGENIDGIYGYDPQTATDLMRNIVLYAGFAHRRAAAPAH